MTARDITKIIHVTDVFSRNDSYGEKQVKVGSVMYLKYIKGPIEFI
eukprot:UN04598